MGLTLGFTLAPLSALVLAGGTPVVAPEPAVAAMMGEWQVDLRFEQGGTPYTQVMRIAISAEGAVSGTFYESPIVAGQVGRAQGRDCLAFRTADLSGDYHSAACLIDGRLVGQTWSEGRGFVLPWTAERR
ncbi:hypothetical protein [Alteraurantiacibacter palmitatis]|uniref:Uncharacterized protein n=1 Tax=Alteraurantiacibacter palmitatis TaxID=2054628 RepID=A0ABV7E6T0_9SPHN